MSKKEFLIYDTLGLDYPGDLNQSHPGYLYLGEIALQDLPPMAVISVMDAWLDRVRRLLTCNDIDRDIREEFYRENFISYQQYQAIHRQWRIYARENRSAEGLIRPESREIKQDIVRKRNPLASVKNVTQLTLERLRGHFESLDVATEKSYVALVMQQDMTILRFFRRKLPFHFPVNSLKRHVLLTGNSGAGKSTLLKQLVRASIDTDEASIIVIDPAGDMAKEIALTGGVPSSRLVYIDPSLRDDVAPVFNPLDVRNANSQSIHLAVEELVSAFEEVIGGQGVGSDLTTNMRALLYPALTVLMEIGGKTLFDLQRFMLNDEALIAAGKQSSNFAVRRFFEAAWMEKKFDPTRLSLYAKLQSLLNSPIFGRIVARPQSSIDLKRCLEDGSITIFNLSKGILGSETAEALGRFIIASVKSIIQSRAAKKVHDRKPVFLIIDEIQNFLTPSIIEILRESRKYGLHLIASTQYINDLDPKIQNAFLSVTNVKMTGKNAVSTLSLMARETGETVENLQQLSCGRFSIKIDTATAITVAVPEPPNGSSDADQWKEIVDHQISRFYICDIPQQRNESDVCNSHSDRQGTQNNLKHPAMEL